MEKLLSKLIEKAKTDKKGIAMLKNTAVRCQQYELAVMLREIEKTNFPETREVADAKKLAALLQGAIAMVGLNVSEDTCWLLNEVIKEFGKKKGEFSLRDASAIKARHEEIFDIEKKER